MNGVFIIPTGVGCSIGGHAGDATPAAKLIAECCDKLIIHPNVVNASDINEMTPNMLYVEGSILDRLLEGKIMLQETRWQNRILVVANKPIRKDTINAVHAAEATIGTSIQIVELNTRLEMIAEMENGLATGTVRGWEELIFQVHYYNYDALAIHTPIFVSREIALNYYKNGGINPWGGVEAKASRLIADVINKPVAHAPVEFDHPDNDPELFLIHLNTIVDKRIAAEAISACYLHCVLKGLHKAPRVVHHTEPGLSIDFLITPDLCYGRPHIACQDSLIPIIVVKENTTKADNSFPGGTEEGIYFVDNYLEAAGFITAMKAGIEPQAVRVHTEISHPRQKHYERLI